MPHFVIEYARPLERAANIDAVMQAVFDAAADSGIMRAEDIKIRAVPYDHYRLHQINATFLHVRVYLLEGRSNEQKEHLAVLLRDRFAQVLPTVPSISIDVRDMNSVAYKKRLLPQ